MRTMFAVFAFVVSVLGMSKLGLAAAPDMVPTLDRAEVLVPSATCRGTLTEIAALPPRCFVPAIALDYTGTVTYWHPITQWLRFSLPETARDAGPWMLVVSTYVTDGDLAVVGDNGSLLATQHFGSVVPIDDRAVRSHDIRVPLPASLPAGARIVVRLESPFSVPQQLEFHTAASLDALDRAASQGTDLIFAFLNGGAVTMALFNVILFGLLRRWIYLIYAAAMGALVLYQVVETGTAWTLLWPHLGMRDDYPSYAVWVLYAALILAFTSRMLNLAEVAPRTNRLLLVVFVLTVIDCAVYVAIPDLLLKIGVFNWIDPLVTAMMYAAMLVAGAVAWQRGVSGAAAYVVAFAGSAIGIVGSDIAYFEPAFAAYPVLQYLPTSFGVAWESVFLAAALGQRVRDAEREAALLSEYAFRDGLTGIANRRAFDEAIESEWSRIQRAGGTLAVAMFDIDHFKAYNDRYGHPAGDERLIAVARVIGAAARRGGDLGARYGGEEFALLLPNTTLDAAFTIAEGVRERITAESGDRELTISAGVAMAFVTNDTKNIRALLGAADAALYSAKKGGRDRTVRWNTPLGGAEELVAGG
jgi:diguanylate cyclase (GGDEF)-like protein